MKKIKPEIGDKIFVIVKGCRKEYDRLHYYNEQTGEAFRVTLRLPYEVIAVDIDGDLWHFPTSDFAFVNPDEYEKHQNSAI